MNHHLDGRKTLPSLPEVLPDLMAGILARPRAEAIAFLERSGTVLLSTTSFVGRAVLLNGVDKAEALAQATGGSLRKDALADWLGGK